MTDAIDLTPEQRKTLNDLLRRFLPGVAVWAYGSRVKWTARPNSDLDLVAFTVPEQRVQVADLKDALAESNLPFPVDLHVWDDVPERFREIIRKEYVVVQEAKEPDGKKGLASEWPTLSLREAHVKLIDCDHRTPPAAEEGYPYVAIPQLRNGRIDLSEARRISHEHFADWTRKAMPVANDIVLSRRCNPGETAFVPPGLEFALGQNLVLLRADGVKVYPPFLRWLVQGPEWWKQIGKFLNVGAVFDSLRCADVPNFELHIPPMTDQRAIAHILGTLDDKIELNRQMNETLEAMARGIFKSWFVDFDPVRAKAQGREPGLPKHIADLFPDALDDSDLGEIPRGWEIGSILKHARLISGGTPKTDRPEYWDGPIAWASAKDVSQAKDLFLIDTERNITERGLDESATQVVPAFCSAVVARGATTGRMALFGRDMAMNQTCYALAATTETPFSLYCRLRQEIDALVHAAHGSVFDTITTSTFVSSRIILPPPSLLNAFETRIAPLFQKVLNNVWSSHTLTALRNTLLPELIAGELRVKDAERFVERAV